MTEVEVLYVAARAEAQRTGRGTAVEHVVEYARDVAVARRMLDRIGDATAFAATLVGHELEASSNRWLVTIEVDGEREHLRTDRLDTPEGAALTRRVRRWRGHRVVIFKEIERTADGRKGVRVLAWLEPIDTVETVSSDGAGLPPRRREEVRGGTGTSEGSVALVDEPSRPGPSTPADPVEPVPYDPGPAPQPREGVDPDLLTGEALIARATAAGLTYLDIAKPVAAWAREHGIEPLLSRTQLRTGRCGPQVLAWVDAIVAAAEADR